MRYFLFFVYVFVTLVCVCASTWSMYHGTASLLRLLALPIAIAAGLILLACDLQLRWQLRKGRGIVGIVTVLLLITALSSASNFNYFYTNAMRNDIVAARLEEASLTFDRNMSRTRTRLDLAADRTGIAERHHDIRVQLDNVRAQCVDPLRPGCGPRAAGHLQRINDLLDPDIPDLALPLGNQPLPIRERFCDNLDRLVNARLQQEVAADPVAAAQRFVDESLAAKETGRAEAARGDFARQRAEIVRMAQQTERVEQVANEALTRFGVQNVALTPVATTYDGLDNIAASLRSGFVERPNFGMTLFAALMSLMIDLIPLVVALVLFRPEDGYAPAPRPGVGRGWGNGRGEIPSITRGA